MTSFKNIRKDRNARLNELRQQRRDDLLSKRRIAKLETQEPVDVSPSMVTIYKCNQMINCNDLNTVFKGTFELRKLLSVPSNPPIQQTIDSGIVPRVVELLSPHCSLYANVQRPSAGDDPAMTLYCLASNTRIEAAWIVTNLASGTTEQTQYVVNQGAVKLLLDMAEEGNEEMTDQAIWAIGNIAGDKEIFRDVIIEHDCVAKVINIVSGIIAIHERENMQREDNKQNMMGNQDNNEIFSFKCRILPFIITTRNIKLLRTCVWLLSNLCRGTDPLPDKRILNSICLVLKKIIYIDDVETVSDCLWGLSYICDSHESFPDDIIQSGIINRIFACLLTLYMRYMKISQIEHFLIDETLFYITTDSLSPILRLVGNIITNSNVYTDYLINLQGFFISEQNINLLGIYRTLYEGFHVTKKLTRVRKEICWTFSNILAGTEQHAVLCVKEHIIELLCAVIRTQEQIVRYEACHALINLITHMNNQEVFNAIMNIDFVSSLIGGIQVCTDTRLIAVVLEGFKEMLNNTKAMEQQCESMAGCYQNLLAIFEKAGALKEIEEYQQNMDENVASLAYELMNGHFKGFGGYQTFNN